MQIDVCDIKLLKLQVRLGYVMHCPLSPNCQQSFSNYGTVSFGEEEEKKRFNHPIWPKSKSNKNLKIPNITYMTKTMTSPNPFSRQAIKKSQAVLPAPLYRFNHFIRLLNRMHPQEKERKDTQDPIQPISN